MDDVDEDDEDTAETIGDETDVVEADTTEADTDVDTDEDADESAVSVFAYTRAPDRSQADEDEFDSGDVKAAVIQLTKRPRVPEQPMDQWDDDE